MNNLNAVFLPASVTGLSFNQPGMVNGISSGISDFQSLISNLLNSDLYSERESVANAMYVNPKIKTAVYQAVSVLNITGDINNIASQQLPLIEANTAVNNILQNSNLTPAERQAVLQGIKLSAFELTIMNITYSAANSQQESAPVINIQDGNVPQQPVINTAAPSPTQAQPVLNIPAPFVPQPEAQPLMPAPVMVDTQPVKPAVIVNPMPASQNPVQADLPVAPQPAVQANTAPPVPTAVPILVQENGAANIQNVPFVVRDNSVKPAEIVTPGVVSNEIIPAEPQQQPRQIEWLAGNINLNFNQNSESIKETLAGLNELAGKLTDIIKSFMILHYMLIEKNPEVAEEAKLINNRVTEAANKLSELNKIAVEGGKVIRIKEALSDLAQNLGSIVISVEKVNITAFNAVSGGNAPLNSGLMPDVNSLVIDKLGINLNSGGSKEQYAALIDKITEGVKDIVSKIFFLLREMNGEMNIFKKIEYVYKPNSSQTSQVTPDGVLLINTGAGRPESFSVMLQALVNEANQVMAAVKAAPAPVQDAPAQNQQAPVSPQAVNVGTAVNTKEMPVPVNNEVNANNRAPENTVYAAPAAQQPGNTGNPEKTAPVYNTAYNTTEQFKDSIGRNFLKDVNWLADMVKSLVVNAKSKESVEAPVAAKVFEQVAGFANNVKENIIIRQVMQHIENAVQVSQKTEIRMFLRPENLGPVIINIEAREKVLTGKIQVVNGEVRDVLKAHVPELRAALMNAGLSVEDFDVSMLNTSVNDNLADSSARNPFREWEGGPAPNNTQDIAEIGDIYIGNNGYLNFLA